MEFVPKIDEINSTTKIHEEENYDEEELVEIFMTNSLEENQFASSLKSLKCSFIQVTRKELEIGLVT